MAATYTFDVFDPSTPTRPQLRVGCVLEQARSAFLDRRIALYDKDRGWSSGPTRIRHQCRWAVGAPGRQSADGPTSGAESIVTTTLPALVRPCST